MHTIPQNVTSYDNKIVGQFVGRQFIYLAIGGVLVFLLLTTQIGPLVIRFFLSVIVAAFAAAMALLKIQDRGFDVWTFAFVKAISGPTEWIWAKEPLAINIPVVADTVMPLPLPPTMEDHQDLRPRERVDQLKVYMEHQAPIDETEEELRAIASLNFAEPIPESAFSLHTVAPLQPMLTPGHQRQTLAPITRTDEPTHSPRPTPITPLAQSTTPHQRHMTIDTSTPFELPIVQNQRPNRSLSRQLLSSGVLPIPIRGELHLNLTSDLKSELANLLGFPPAGAVSATNPTWPLKIEVEQLAVPSPMPPIVREAVVMPATPPSRPTTPSVTTIPSAGFNSLMPNVAAPLVNKPLAVSVPLGPAQPITVRTENMHSSAPLRFTPPQLRNATTVNFSASSPASSTVVVQKQKVASSRDLNATDEAELEKLLHGYESVIKELDHQVAPAQSPRIPLQTSAQTGSQGFTNSPLPTQPLATPVAQNLNPAIDPVALEQLSRDVAAKIAQSTRRPESEPIQPVASPNKIVTLPNVLPLTNQPNVINGVVLDDQGLFISGVIVVVKDDKREPKRALKTNKLGQFVITTPLPDGAYTIEIDKKGLVFDIMNVQLGGGVVLPLSIQGHKA